MTTGHNRSRWIFVVIVFLFLLFNQLMGFFVEPITSIVSKTSTLVDRWFTPILPIDLIIMLIFFMVWGVSFDRHSRKRLLSLAGFLWGATAWLMGISPTFATFQISTAAFGISRASYSGIFAMVGDLFKPTNRGKVFSLLLLTQPFAIFLGVIFENIIRLDETWRWVLILFGAIGLLITLSIHLKVEEPKRGDKEPALTIFPLRGTYILDWDVLKQSLFKKSLILIYLLIFLGTIPVVTLLNGNQLYLNEVFGMAEADIYLLLLPAMIGVVLGYPVGGVLGDSLFVYKKYGRLVPCLLGFFVPPIFLFLALRSQDIPGQAYMIYMLTTCFFMAFSLPNLFASIMDVTLPEVRSSAGAVGLLFQTLSIMITPVLLSFVQNIFPIGDVILGICIGGWVVCLGISILLLFWILKDIEDLRRHMAHRSYLEARLS